MFDVGHRHYLGAAYSAGLGVEFRTPAPVTPFVEVRYEGGFGACVDGISPPFFEFDRENITMHTMSLSAGLSFL